MTTFEVRCTVNGRSNSIRDSGTDVYDTLTEAAERAHTMNSLDDGSDLVYYAAPANGGYQ